MTTRRATTRTPTRVAGVAAILAFGVLAPSLAAAAAVIVVLVALVVTLARSFEATREIDQHPLDPFGPGLAQTPSVETPDVTELLREIESAGRRVPPRIIGSMRMVARGRLLDHHRIELDSEPDRARVVAMLSPTLATIVVGDDPVVVPLRELDGLLIELENL